MQNTADVLSRSTQLNPTADPSHVPIVSPRARACKVWPFRPPPSAASDLTGTGSGGVQATMRCVADCRRTLASRHCSSASAQVFSGLLQIEWVKWGGFSRVDGDSKGFFVN